MTKVRRNSAARLVLTIIVHVESEQSVECDVSFAHARVRSMNLSVQAQHHGYGVFGHGVGEYAGTRATVSANAAAPGTSTWLNPADLNAISRTPLAWSALSTGSCRSSLTNAQATGAPVQPSSLAPALLQKTRMAQQPSNLTMHRAPESVWDRHDSEHSRTRAMGVLGFALIAAGTALVGLAYKSQLAILKCRAGAVLPSRARKFDEVNKAAYESFPASDPPAFTPAVGKPTQPDSIQ